MGVNKFFTDHDDTGDKSLPDSSGSKILKNLSGRGSGVFVKDGNNGISGMGNNGAENSGNVSSSEGNGELLRLKEKNILTALLPFQQLKVLYKLLQKCYR